MHPSINRIRLARLRRGLYQRDLAQKTGIHATYLSLFETGKARPTADQADRIAEVLGVDVNDLLEELQSRSPAGEGPGEGGR